MICAVLVIIAVFAIKPTSSEPSYGGQPLSYWVEMLGIGAGSESEYQTATNAIDHIGVTALPFLVKWVHNDSSGWKYNLGALLYRIGLRPAAERMMTGTRRQRLANGTHECFRILRSKALPVVDELGGSLVSGTNGPETDVILILGLRCFGTNALPALFAVATNENHSARWQAREAIGEMPELGDASQELVYVLTNAIYVTETNNPSGQLAAVYVLGTLKAAPKISLPAIVFCLQSTDAELRASSAEALGNFGTEAVSFVPALTNALVDSSPKVRKSATEALRQIESAVFSNAPPNL